MLAGSSPSSQPERRMPAGSSPFSSAERRVGRSSRLAKRRTASTSVFWSSDGSKPYMSAAPGRAGGGRLAGLLAQHPLQDLAGGGLGQGVGEADAAGGLVDGHLAVAPLRDLVLGDLAPRVGLGHH